MAELSSTSFACTYRLPMRLTAGVQGGVHGFAILPHLTIDLASYAHPEGAPSYRGRDLAVQWSRSCMDEGRPACGSGELQLAGARWVNEPSAPTAAGAGGWRRRGRGRIAGLPRLHAGAGASRALPGWSRRCPAAGERRPALLIRPLTATLRAGGGVRRAVAGPRRYRFFHVLEELMTTSSEHLTNLDTRPLRCRRAEDRPAPGGVGVARYMARPTTQRSPRSPSPC
jgi:hypothetical protein